MGKLRHLLTTVGALAFGTGMGAYDHNAHAAVTAKQIERDCERALRENTIESLEAFFIKYPPKKYRRKNIACYALAFDAYSDFDPAVSEHKTSERIDPPNSGHYGD